MRFVPFERHRRRRYLPALLGYFESLSPRLLNSDREVVYLEEVESTILWFFVFGGLDAYVVPLTIRGSEVAWLVKS